MKDGEFHAIEILDIVKAILNSGESVDMVFDSKDKLWISAISGTWFSLSAEGK
jgi:hypothetical protein